MLITADSGRASLILLTVATSTVIQHEPIFFIVEKLWLIYDGDNQHCPPMTKSVSGRYHHGGFWLRKYRWIMKITVVNGVSFVCLHVALPLSLAFCNGRRWVWTRGAPVSLSSWEFEAFWSGGSSLSSVLWVNTLRVVLDDWISYPLMWYYYSAHRKMFALNTCIVGGKSLN